MTVQRCPFCGALPRGVGGSTGTHRRDCPGRELADILADWLRRLDDLEQLLVPEPPDYRTPQDEDGTP